MSSRVRGSVRAKADYGVPAIICYVLAGLLFLFFIVSSIIYRDEGANIGGGFAAFIGLLFATLAGYLRKKPPAGRDL